MGEWGPGETGPRFQNPITGTQRPTETRVPREACHRLRAGVLTGGPALRVPLLGRQSIQPQGRGCEHRKSTEAQGAPICGGAGGPPDTPAPGCQPCTWACWRTAVRPAGRASLYTTAWPQVWLRPPGPWLGTQLLAQETGLRRAAKVSLPVRAAPSQRPGMVTCNWPVTAAPRVVGGSRGSEFL